MSSCVVVEVGPNGGILKTDQENLVRMAELRRRWAGNTWEVRISVAAYPSGRQDRESVPLPVSAMRRLSALMEPYGVVLDFGTMVADS